MRNRQEHFIYSKVMNWVALDRGARLADKRALPADRAKWIHERDCIYEEVMTRGWNEKQRAFTQFYGSEDLECLASGHAAGFFHGAERSRRMLEHDSGYPRQPTPGRSGQR